MRLLVCEVLCRRVARARLAAAVLLLCGSALPALAQSATIGGVVRDPQQAVVPGADVVLSNLRTAAKTTAATNGEGRYQFANLAVDTYVVEVHAKGFQVAAAEPIVLAAGQAVVRDVALQLAGAVESVTVTAPGGASRGYRVATVDSLGPLGPAVLL